MATEQGAWAVVSKRPCNSLHSSPPAPGRPVSAAAELALSAHEPHEQLQECQPAESRSPGASPHIAFVIPPAAREYLGVSFNVDMSEMESKQDTLWS